MAVKLPKHLIGVKFDQLFSIEMNNFDVEMLLPALFWLVRSGGKDRGRANGKGTDATDIQRYAVALARHPRLTGFTGEEGSRLLDKWIRSSLIQTSAVGKRKSSEQIAYIRPLSFLCYKPSVPKQGSRLRQAHHFLYHLLNGYLRREAQDSGGAARYFDKLVQDTFARGVALNQGVSKGGAYDGYTPLDLEVLLQLYYVDGFDAPQESNRGGKEPPPPACHLAAAHLAQDVAGFLTVYARRVPTATLSKYLMALLNFELLIYTLRLMRATDDLVVRNEIAPEFRPEATSLSPLDMYVDMTQVRGSRSDQIAMACVNRDFEEQENFFRSRLMLRTLHSYVEEDRDIRSSFRHKAGGEYVTALWGVRDNDDVRSSARRDLREIEKMFRGEDDDEENVPTDVRAILDHPDLNNLSRLVEILVLVQRKYGMNNLSKWIADIGGLRRQDGILRGNSRGRRVWRYVMSDTLLEALVQLAVISPEAQAMSGEREWRREPRSITLSAFLAFLRDRFGLLIDTPPPFDSSSEATAAAKENFSALKQRLRQMGLFMDLSDDFNAQRIFPRFRKEVADVVDAVQDQPHGFPTYGGMGAAEEQREQI